MMVNRATMKHCSRRDPQTALKLRLRELAATRVRFGYRRLTVMLRREGWAVNAKRIYRLYTADGLAVRTKVRKKIARRVRIPAQGATRPNEKWSMDFVAARLLDGRWFRVLTVVDQFTRECLLLLADSSLSGHKVALALSQVVAERGAPVSITVDNVLRQESRDTSGQSSPVACGASGFANNCRQRRVASAAAYRQGFARQARRRAPPLTDARAAAGSQLAGA
jgi:putative transposase